MSDKQKSQFQSALLHLIIFVFIEVAFVFIVLHEFPNIAFFEWLGILHLVYWIMIIFAGFIREKLHRFYLKFLATFLPLFIHVLWHVYIGHDALEHGHISWWWLWWATVILGIFILVGEYILHNYMRYKRHHQKIHKECDDL